MVNKEVICASFLKIYCNKYYIYPLSIISCENNLFFMVKDCKKKYLIIIGDFELSRKFEGIFLKKINLDNKDFTIKKIYLNNNNLTIIQEIFPCFSPSICSLKKSFGTGDRLGIATPAHIKAIANKNFFPVLGQQSVRELKRTDRNWEDVLSGVIWGCFESGYKDVFGIDADHIKEASDLKMAVDAGFSMFTVDPSDFIQDICNLNKSDITEKYYSLENLGGLEKKYLNKNFKLEREEYFIDQDILITMAVKYKRAIDHVADLYNFLKDYKIGEFDFEVSMDEVEQSVTPLEHYFISEELRNSGVDFQNLALRFVGRWEKAIDYIGDMEALEKNLREHCKILKIFGDYKLSLHSGSEKFSTYKIFSDITLGNFHIKTAGTSWLEALRTIANCAPSLFRSIYSFSQKCFIKDRDSYHLTTDSSKLKDIYNATDRELKDCLDMAEARQMLHVTFGSILTGKSEDKELLFRKEIYSELFNNEDLHYHYVTSNITKHLDLIKD